MPIILHLDFNSFFASVEQQANPFLRHKAIAVGGKSGGAGAGSAGGRAPLLARTVVTTASKEAKALGIKTAMGSLEAKKILPSLIMVQGDPQKYSEITKRFLRIMRRYSDAVEQFSTDEAFADITYAAGDYFGATALALQIKEDIANECGSYCTVSIGVAPNKLVAKLACESMKPNGLTIVPPNDLINFIDSQPLAAFCGIGSQTEIKLANLGISDVKSLRRAPLSLLRSHFKSQGDWLYLAARGVGDDQVSDKIEDPKSIGHSYTFPYDLELEAEIKTNLLALSDKVAFRMRRDGFFATQVSAFVRHARFPGVAGPGSAWAGVGAQRQMKDGVSDGLEIYKNAWNIINKIRDPKIPIRLLGVSVSGLIKAPLPSRLFKKDQKTHQALKALDEIQNKFGSDSWRRGATLKTVFLERTSGWHYDHEA